MAEPRPPVAPKSHSSPIAPTQNQAVVIYVVLVYTVVIFGLWNMPGMRKIINPFKLMTVGWHELCHIAMAILTGGGIESVTIDPNDGGATRVVGGHPPTILCAGYIGSSLMGGLFIMAGFDTLVAKIMSFVIGIGLLIPTVLVRDKLTILLTLLYEGLLVGFWFVDHASALRWYCLFVGVMNIFYVVWDISDEKFFRKANDSDATQFSLLYPRISPHVWAFLWILFEVAVLIGFMFLGIAEFKMQAEAATFLPT
ncbi:hypothetical protein SISSUDRAFT_741838 [Sistotremastrum suecicum HHB10207 ss-3]|uniref:Peptidase M50B-like-domain-containing protein n=1 Tax=Sistotremastrum suecicum HHB10207 ss-3 TaxID=1314776 RepID=A0A166HVS7_9AGAM|nr:hypothetical protein SISSUDRAFT_741838 [Sistotremastrum suecicum HHB10207 ss-3]